MLSECFCFLFWQTEMTDWRWLQCSALPLDGEATTLTSPNQTDPLLLPVGHCNIFLISHVSSIDDLMHNDSFQIISQIYELNFDTILNSGEFLLLLFFSINQQVFIELYTDSNCRRDALSSLQESHSIKYLFSLQLNIMYTLVYIIDYYLVSF